MLPPKAEILNKCARRPDILLMILSGDGVFHTLQGEGETAGVPTVFVRLQGCNLRCKWRNGGACDAKYTWDAEHAGEARETSSSEVAEEIKRFDCRRVTWTGGEPVLQQDEILETIRILPADYAHELQTNGAVPLKPEFLAEIDLLNCSPKLPSSDNPKEAAFRPDVLASIAGHPHAWFFFVIPDHEALAEAEKYVRGANLPEDRIVLMPEGVTRDVLNERMRWLANECLKRGWRLSPRLQIDLWDNERRH